MNKSSTPDYTAVIKQALKNSDKHFCESVVHIKSLRYYLIKKYKLYYITDKNIKDVLTNLGLVYKPACVAIYNTTMKFWTVPGMTPEEIRSSLVINEKPAVVDSLPINHQIFLNTNRDITV